MITGRLQQIKAAGLAALFFVASIPLAHALPPGQRDFDSNSVNSTQRTDNKSTSFFAVVPSTIVTVNNDVTRTCVIQFSVSFAASPSGDLIQAGFVVDSLNPNRCKANGPRYFGNGSFTAIWPVAIGAGLHTIRACFGALENSGDKLATAALDQRSLTVECRTQ